MPEVGPALDGISAMPVTPFTDEGELDEVAFRRLVARLAASGVDSIIPAGHVGEFTSLTQEEIISLTKMTIEEAKSRVCVLASVGGDVISAQRLARVAHAAGADGIMVHFPQHPFQSDAGLMHYYESIADVANGSVIVYVRAAGLSESVLEHFTTIPNIVGIKYGLADVVALSELVRRYGGRLKWVCGLAEMWAPFFWLVGARGFTSGLVNITSEYSLALLKALREGNMASAMHLAEVIAPFELLRNRERGMNNVSVVKEAMAMCGLASGSVRPPLASLSDADCEELERILFTWDAVRPHMRTRTATLKGSAAPL